MKRIQTEVCVVGGGASGLMAAVTAASAGAEVMVLERQERPARKLRITGKGRCNLTNNCPPEDVLKHVTRNGRFLYSAVSPGVDGDRGKLHVSAGRRNLHR